jgi:high affinity sulfate transporter 1
LDEWRLMFQPGNWLADLGAAAAVALVALPLSLAIATASGVDPRTGLVTAIVGGIVVALLGGCRFQVSGPAAAMTFLVYEIISKYEKIGIEDGMGKGYGLTMLIAATLLAGILQLASGIFRLGRFMQFIPRPVVTGFLSGIGITILCSQLPKVLGFDVPHEEEGGAIGLLLATLRNLPQTSGPSLSVGVLAIFLMRSIPRLHRGIPAPLVAVVGASILPVVMRWSDSQIEFLGPVPTGLPLPKPIQLPWERWNEWAGNAMTIFFLASLESLLSASVVTAMVRRSSVDNDQELVGQGFGNIASACFAGIPVTGVIARSATNIQAGARSRLSAILHAVFLLLMMLALGPFVARIPIAALAGVLCAVAVRMIEPHVIRTLWRGSRLELAVYLATAGTILVTDLIIGIPVGIAASFAYVVLELSRLQIRQAAETPSTELSSPVSQADASLIAPAPCPQINILQVEGPLFFASGFHLRNMVANIRATRCLILDLSAVPFLDVTGAEILEESMENLARQGTEVVLVSPSPLLKERIRELGRSQAPTLAECGLYDTLREALLHATARVSDAPLCPGCASSGRCRIISAELAGYSTTFGTTVPSVRAVLDKPLISNQSSPPPAVIGMATAISHPQIHVDPDTCIDPKASIEGRVTIEPGVVVRATASLRGEPDAPLHIAQDCVLHEGARINAVSSRVILVNGQAVGVYLAPRTHMAQQSVILGPSALGISCTLGLAATVHDSIIGEDCVIGHGATVVGVSIPPGRFVPHHAVITTQAEAEALPPLNDAAIKCRDALRERPIQNIAPRSTT